MVSELGSAYGHVLTLFTTCPALFLVSPRWCEAFCNPFTCEAMKAGADGKLGVNTEVAEQRFRHVNRFQLTLREMKKERHQWTLLSIVDQDHKFRASGALRVKTVAMKVGSAELT